MKNNYFVYFLANDFGTLYIGVTNDIERRLNEHKSGIIEGFSKKYNCHKLVYFETFNNINEAITKEKQFKKRNRDKKAKLINLTNSSWEDISLKW